MARLSPAIRLLLPFFLDRAHARFIDTSKMPKSASIKLNPWDAMSPWSR